MHGLKISTSKYMNFLQINLRCKFYIPGGIIVKKLSFQFKWDMYHFLPIFSPDISG